MQVINSLDTFQKLDMSAFGTEFMSLKSGKFALDLSIMKRHLKDVVVVDLSREHIHGAQDHIILMNKFESDPTDSELNKLTPLLLRMPS